jgi:hypothetical protein
MPPSEGERDVAAHGLAAEDYPLQPALIQQLGDVVGEQVHAGELAGPLPRRTEAAQVGHDQLVAAERLDLG